MAAQRRLHRNADPRLGRRKRLPHDALRRGLRRNRSLLPPALPAAGPARQPRRRQHPARQRKRPPRQKRENCRYLHHGTACRRRAGRHRRRHFPPPAGNNRARPRNPHDAGATERPVHLLQKPPHRQNRRLPPPPDCRGTRRRTAANRLPRFGRQPVRP